LIPEFEQKTVLKVAVSAPLRQLYDYLPVPGQPLPSPGCRLWVPFGPSRRMGVVVSVESAIPATGRKLKNALELVDRGPLIATRLLNLLLWAADYYQHPVGEVCLSAFPVRMRKALPPPARCRRYRLKRARDEIHSRLSKRATRQQKIVEALARAGDAGLERQALNHACDGVGNALKRLIQDGHVDSFEVQAKIESTPGPALNPEQQNAVEVISTGLQSFRVFLLKGITGSGKTEIYISAARQVLASKRQVLLLVPEIALTPQLVSRLQKAMGQPVALLHSGLGEGERHRAWLDAASNRAKLIIGTRSAVFCEIPDLGLIVVDEEHDASFKQQEGFHYNARDVAVKRAALSGIPVILGSATPSLESWRNAELGRYTRIDLPNRAGGAALPDIRVVDLERWPLNDGLSPPLVQAIAARLKRGEQSLVFINRRGYAPMVMCGCGWQARCRRCDAFMTLHRSEGRMRCHHCGSNAPLPEACPECGNSEVFFAGVGTQRVEQALGKLFPEARISRIDRDNTNAQGALEQKLEQVRERQVDILVGTQILSKGHDFPGITLVCVLNADQGMYSVDFRAGERLFQSVTQVAGRAGRGKQAGQVLLQSNFVGHPLLQSICDHDYEAFAENELQSRQSFGWPPFRHLVLMRAESVHPNEALTFLHEFSRLVQSCDGTRDIEVMDPVPASMERRAGRFRAQLLLQSSRRGLLGDVLKNVLKQLDHSKTAKRVRWRVDVDPVDLYY